MKSGAPHDSRLERSITLPLLVFFGVGTMVGGGFYALVGKVIGLSGIYAPLSILVAGLFVLPSALSFAELSSRYPLSAGEPVYIQKAFGFPVLSIVVGWLVISTGIVSAATLANAIVEFLQDYFKLERWLGISSVVFFLGLIAAWRIGASTTLVAVITIVEVAGLLYIIGLSSNHFIDLPYRYHEFELNLTLDFWVVIVLGSFLIFYAFLGIEDMVNMAEEVKRPHLNLPLAIYWTLAVTTLLYFLVTLAAVLSLPSDQLAVSNNALADVAESNGSERRALIALVAIFSGSNGALVQIIMAARMSYGMSSKGLGPVWFSYVNPITRTPLRATLVVSILVLFFGLWLPLETLAQITSGIILMVFALVNLALWWIKGNGLMHVAMGPCFPRWVSGLGFIVSFGFLAFRLIQALAWH